VAERRPQSAAVTAMAPGVAQRCFQSIQCCNAKLSAATVVTIIICMGLVATTLDFEELYSSNSTQTALVPPDRTSSNYGVHTNPTQAVTQSDSEHSQDIVPPGKDVQDGQRSPQHDDSQESGVEWPPMVSESDKESDAVLDRKRTHPDADSPPQSSSNLGQPTRFQARSSFPDASLADAIPDSTTFEKRFPSLWRDFHPSAAKYPKGFKPLLPSDVGLKPTPLNASLPYVVSDEQYAVNLAPQLLKHRRRPYVCLAKPVNNCLRTLFYRGASHPGVVGACKGFEYTTGAHFKTFKDLPSAAKSGILAKHWDDYICAKNSQGSDTFCSYNPATLMIEPPVQKVAVQDVLNVVAVQLDAISRTRFRYTYPETAKYLENMNDPTSTEAKDAFSRAFDFP
jgi:hypothetical protein